MSRERSAVYEPEELALLGRIFDQSVAALPAAMRTPANRTEIARIILGRAAAGELEPAPLVKLAAWVERGDSHRSLEDVGFREGLKPTYELEQ
jgi:hypothetical protein